MNVELLAAGTRAPAWVEQGFREYQKRLVGDWKLTLTQVPVAKRTKATSTAKLKEQEGDKMLGLVKPGSMLIALDAGGERFTTGQFAEAIDGWRQVHGRLQMMIGGPDGLADGCLSAASKVMSLSSLTFPHFLVRILVAEQLYRAWSVLNNHPYHK